MTGYGKAECEFPRKKITIEIKSLNSKQLDINTRLPNIYKAKDIEIRKLIAEKLVRGKVEMSLYFEQMGEETNASINQAVVKNYYEQLMSVYNDLGLAPGENMIHTIMRMPDAVKVGYDELDEEEWEMIADKINEALDSLNQFREQEGQSLEDDLRNQVAIILQLKEEVTPFEDERIDRIKSRISDALKDIKNNVQNDPNRFEQELIFYLEKLDINEEKVRLSNHCKYFLETLEEDTPGKKLAFISQEIGREINTMGSKANHAEIQKLVIRMKEALEKIKEQSLNAL